MLEFIPTMDHSNLNQCFAGIGPALPRLWPGTRGIKKPAPKAQGAQKKGKRREKRDYFNYIPIYLYLKVYQTVDKNEAVQFISFSLIREK